MTDARFPERWLNDRRILRLSDAEFRTFVVSLAWSVSNRTDGRLESEDLDLIPGCRAQDHGPAMVGSGLWQATSDGFTIVDFEGTQSTRHELEVLENGRRRDREKKARQRARKDAPDVDDPAPPEPVPRDVPGDGVPRDSTGRTGQAGKAGKDNKKFTDDEASEPQAWTPAVVPAAVLDNDDKCPECAYVWGRHDGDCSRRSA